MQINTTNYPMKHAKSIIERIRKSEGLPFGDLLSKELINRQLDEHQYRDRIFTPAMTIFAFLMQVMGEDQSCQQAVAQVIAHYARDSESLPSANTAAYCKARQRLPEKYLSGLAKATAVELEQTTTPSMLWRNRHIKLPDGTTLSMPDTVANQAAWPQSQTPKKALGFQ